MDLLESGKQRYQPLEINASDESTASVLTEKTPQFMESKSNFYNNDSRPNCLILNEIGGICDKATMKAILNIIVADMSMSQSKLDKSKSVKKLKKNLYVVP